MQSPSAVLPDALIRPPAPQVILMDEFVAALTTSASDSVWGSFPPDEARALFQQIDVTRTGKVTKAK